MFTVLLATPAGARELVRFGDVSLDLSGSLRQILIGTRATDEGDFENAASSDLLDCLRAARFADCAAFDEVGEQETFQSLTRARMRFDLRTGVGLSARIVYDHEVRAGDLDIFENQIAGAVASDAWLDLDGRVTREGSQQSWRHLLYRGFVRFENRWVDLVVGRQRIPWGVGRLWNPIDRFNAIPPLAIEPDQTPGVDAVDLKLRWSGFGYLEAVYQPRPGSDDAYALRAHGIVGEADYSLVVGWFDEAFTTGFDLATNLWDAAGRLEVVYTDPRRSYHEIGESRAREVPDFWQVVASVDYHIDLGRGLYTLVEYFYNGNATGFGRGKAGSLLAFFEASETAPVAGIPASLGPFVQAGSSDRLGGSRLVSAALHQVGVQLGYEWTPLVRTDFLTIVDATGGSAAFFPTAVVTPIDSVELTLGAQLFAGPTRSQFGRSEHLFYLIAEYFF